jgi:hypothetical protein
MPQRQYNAKRCKVTKVNKRIILPITWTDYRELSQDATAFRGELDQMIATYPELFPSEIAAGYTLHDVLPPSLKMPEVQLRRIGLKQKDELGQAQVLTIASSDILPYMTGYTDEVEKALFLRRFGVPYWALTYVFGRNDNYWYRLDTHLGRYEIVGTTLKTSEKLPHHLLADEKHVRFNGHKGYIATTVGADCVLGASLCLSADEIELTEAYHVFKAEAHCLDPAYEPQTVNLDGWLATQKAWQALFVTITVIECFLHAFLKIRDCCKKRWRAVFDDLQQQVWDIYRASDAQDFRQKATDFLAWGRQTLTGPALEAVEKLVAKTDKFILAFDFPGAYRTSNMIDRHMEPMDRWLYSSRFFHGHWSSAELQIRAWALSHNFWPYCPRAKAAQQFISPAHQLNGFVYHDNWLHNLLISTSSTCLTSYHRIRQN